jgi:uncharacterized protein
MTIDEVEALIKSKTRNKVRIHVLEERVGDSIAFLSYSIDDKNQMTIWHTESHHRCNTWALEESS